LVLSSAFISITSVSFKTTKRTRMCPNIQGSRIIDCSISYHSNTTWRGVNCCHWHKWIWGNWWEQSHFLYYVDVL
jgi:hypothetical protein